MGHGSVGGGVAVSGKLLENNSLKKTENQGGRLLLFWLVVSESSWSAQGFRVDKGLQRELGLHRRCNDDCRPFLSPHRFLVSEGKCMLSAIYRGVVSLT